MKGFVVTANYQDVTPEMIRVVAAYVDERFGSFSGPSEQGTLRTLDYLAKGLEQRASEKAKAGELAALGGTEAAERGWNALRKHNPNVDKSNGLPGGEIVTFSDLSHRQKVNYVVFAAGVLNGKRSPRVFGSAKDEPPLDVKAVRTQSEDYPYARRCGEYGWCFTKTLGDGEEMPGRGWCWSYLSSYEFPFVEVVS